MNDLEYYILDSDKLFDLAQFVVQENYNHHIVNHQQRQKEIEMVYQEDLKLNNSKIFVSQEDNCSIFGSIRVINWNHIDILPIEKLFKINIFDLIQNKTTNVYHIGRFAIKKGIDKTGFIVFKTLMVCAINEVCRSENSLALAECDVKLLRILKLMGIEAITLADSINYLGSETIPVMLSYNSLKSFLDKNINLLPQTLTSLHQSIVLQKNTENYTLV